MRTPVLLRDRGVADACSLTVDVVTLPARFGPSLATSLDVDSLRADQARVEIVDSMHVMSNAANRLVVSAQLRLRRLPDDRDDALAGEIQRCVNALLADFDRLRALLWTLQHGDGADGSAD